MATNEELSEKISDSELQVSNLKFSSILKFKTEILAGLTVALALVPEAVSFSFVAGVHPLVGLYAAFIVGLITALIGGRPGMISGATGALMFFDLKTNFLNSSVISSSFSWLKYKYISKLFLS